MIILTALNYIDAVAPNAIPQLQKLRWLAQLEGLILSQIHFPGAEAKVPEFDDDTDLNTELLASGVGDSLYQQFLEMMVYYTHGETERYNQSAAMFQSAWNGYQNYYNRTHLPPRQTIQYG